MFKDEYQRSENMIVNYPIKCVQVFHISTLETFNKGTLNVLQYLEQQIPASNNNEFYEKKLVLNEMTKSLTVGLFHLWLHNLQEFLYMGGDAINKYKKNMCHASCSKILSLFKEEEIYGLRDTLIKYSTLVNAIKHGIGPSYDDLSKNYREFFYPSSFYSITDSEDFLVEYAFEPLVTPDNYNELYSTLLLFWKNIPQTICIDFNKLKDVK